MSVGYACDLSGTSAGYRCSPPDVAVDGYLCGRESMRTTRQPAWFSQRCDRHEHRPTAARYGFSPDRAPVHLPACRLHVLYPASAHSGSVHRTTGEAASPGVHGRYRPHSIALYPVAGFALMLPGE